MDDDLYNARIPERYGLEVLQHVPQRKKRPLWEKMVLGALPLMGVAALLVWYFYISPSGL